MGNGHAGVALPTSDTFCTVMGPRVVPSISSVAMVLFSPHHWVQGTCRLSVFPIPALLLYSQCLNSVR